MLARLWVHRVIVGLLAAGYGVLLPAHHHALGHAPHGDHGELDPHEVELAETHDDDDHHHHGDHDHGEPGDGSGHHGDGHTSDCGICHAVRTLYTPVAAPLPVLAPQSVTASVPVDVDAAVSVRPPPGYHGRAPPASL